MTNHPQGLLFPAELQQQIRDRFLHVSHDHRGRERLYFDNAGGSFRLRTTVERLAQIDAIPDNAERIHDVAEELKAIQAKATDDVRLILNAEGGSVYAALTASGAMFDLVRAVAENVPGSNLVTTALEHPSAFDAMAQYATLLGKELRVTAANPTTGGVDVEEIVRHIDADTCLLNVIYASNISGAKLDLAAVVRRARAIKPDIYILVDAVQHAPHGLIDLRETPVDGITLAPYKFFGCRGSGIAWVSARASVLPHHKLSGKKPDFWDLGSSAPGQFAVISEIVDYVCWIGGHFSESTDRRALFVAGITHIELHERALLARLLEGSDATPGLRHIPGVEVFVDHPDLSKRDLIIGIGFDRIEHTQAVHDYAQHGVTVYERVVSSIYSKRMLESLGLTGSVRISPLHCHTTAEIDRFLQVTQTMAQRAAG